MSRSGRPRAGAAARLAAPRPSPCSGSCSRPPAAAPTRRARRALRVVATETFLADIAQNVAGDRFTVQSLLPPGADPHAYEPTPRDVADVAAADLLIVNGGGLEGPLLTTLQNAGGAAQGRGRLRRAHRPHAAARRAAAGRRADRPPLLARPEPREDVRRQHPRRVLEGRPRRGGGVHRQRRRLRRQADRARRLDHARRWRRSRPRTASSSPTTPAPATSPTATGSRSSAP